MTYTTFDEKNNLWKKALERISEVTDKKIMDAFFKNSYIYSVESNKIIISCESNMACEMLKQVKYLRLTTEIINELTESNFNIVFEYENNLKSAEKPHEVKKKKSPFFANNFLEPSYNFDNFVVGPSNKEAHSASLIVASSPGELYNPLFLYSSSGLGKTHLLNAIGNYIKETTPAKKVLYCSSQDFVDEYIKYVNGEKSEDNLKDYILNFDALLIDDIQLLQNKEKTEEFFFGIFELFIKNNKQIVLTCDRLPEELNGLDKRLVTRFIKGLTISIKQPTVELCEEILKLKISNSGLDASNFSDEVINYIASNFKNSIRDLEGALLKIIFHSSLYPTKQIDIDFCLDALSNLINTKKSKKIISEQRILNTVSSYYNISVNQITGKLKNSQIVIARQVAIYLIRTLLNTSYTRIGEIFSNRDHSTIMHSVKKVEEMLKTDDNLLKAINTLKTKI